MHSCSDNNNGPDFLVPNMFWCFIEKNVEGFQNFSILFNPEQLRIYFSGLIFTTAQVVHITARITFIHIFIHSSNI